MAGPIFSNNAVGTLAASYGIGATAITLSAGQGIRFPAPGAGEWFSATIVDASNNIEIVRVTGRTADTFTVVRGQEGTAARALGMGEKIEHRLTAGDLGAIRDRALDASQIPAGSITASKLAANSVDGSKIVDGSISGADIAAGQIGSGHLVPGAVVNNLGYVPIQQGGGNEQLNSKVFIGWTAHGKLKAQVDATDTGFLLQERQDGSVGSAGYRGVPINVHNENYVIGFVDAGTMLIHSGGDHTYTLPSTAIPFADGVTIQLFNRGGNLTIVPAAGMSLLWAPSGAVGARTLGVVGLCTVQRVDGATWLIYGAGLS